MTARDDYPLLAFYDENENSAGEECARALDEIDRHREQAAEVARAIRDVNAMNDDLAIEIDRLRSEAKIAKAFYDLTVAQRNAAWAELQQRKDLDGWNVHGR